MGEPEESLAGELAPSGVLAWQRLHGDVSSQLMVEMRDRRRPSSGCRWRSRAASRRIPTPTRRRAAYEGELAAWETVAVPLAAALNGAKGELGVLNRRRGFADDLEPALRANNVDRATLDAMTDAVVASLPTLPPLPARQGARCSATTAGCRGGISSRRSARAEAVPWSGATDRVRDAFAGFSPDLDGAREPRVRRAVGRRRDPRRQAAAARTARASRATSAA